LALAAIIAVHRFWSNYIKEVKFFFGILGQFLLNVKQLVLDGFATTNILAVSFAYFSNKKPYCLKISLLIYKRSDLSIPGFLGNPPKNIPTSISLNAIAGSEVTSIDVIN